LSIPTQSDICRARYSNVRQSAAYGQMLDTSNWRSICAITLTIKQARLSAVPAGAPYTAPAMWFAADEIRCKKAFRHFMSLLNRTVYGSAYRRHNKRLRVIPVLEKSCAGRWHFHAAIEPPAHLDVVDFETLIHQMLAADTFGPQEDSRARPGQ
jgi:hypothetical protein